MKKGTPFEFTFSYGRTIFFIGRYCFVLIPMRKWKCYIRFLLLLLLAVLGERAKKFLPAAWLCNV